jgi:hypothetical protein
VALVGLVLASACTTASLGEPRPATETTATSGEPPFAGAPKVDDPLDTSRSEADPCRALTADQTRHVTLGTGCEWKNTESRGYAQIVSADGDQYGLSAAYQANEDGDWEYFEELPAPGDHLGGQRQSIAQLSEGNGQKDPCAMTGTN